MIKFQDFKKDKKTSGDGEIDCVRKMNEWIENNTVSIMSIETIVKEYRFVCVRLWYKEER
mgnify:CR=1 FL=1